MITPTPPAPGQPRAVPLVRVVHCREEKFDLYIGRAVLGVGLHASLLQNTHRITRDTPENRAHAIALFQADFLAPNKGHVRAYLLGEYRAHQRRLPGSCFTLGCWCKDHAHPDRACHGDVLAEWLISHG